MAIFKKTIIYSCLALVIINAGLLAYFLKNRIKICKNCNVILISVDTLAAEHLPCYGYDRNTAPNLCKMAKENLMFSTSYSQSNWTLPSHFSIFTGLRPSTHGVLVSYRDTLSPKRETLTQVLKKNGYSTYFYGPTNDPSIPLDKGMERGFDYFDKSYNDKSLDAWKKGLKTVNDNNKKGVPTFLFLHTYEVHGPYLPGIKDQYQFIKKINPKIPITLDEYGKMTEDLYKFIVEAFKQRVAASKTEASKKRNTDIYNQLVSVNDFSKAKDILDKSLNNDEKLGYLWDMYEKNTYSSKNEKAQYLRNLYDEGIFNFDTEFGKVMAMIDKETLKNTIIIVTADHGESFNEHGVFGHCDGSYCLYNETIKVPLIFKIPGMGAKVSQKIAQGIDIFPTIMDLLGIKNSPETEGQSLVKNNKGSENAFVEENFIYKGRAIADKNWKLYVKDISNINNKNNIEFYDLKNDPQEKKNVANQNETLVKIYLTKMNDYLLQEKISLKNLNVNSTFPDWIDDIKKKKLIENGYF